MFKKIVKNWPLVTLIVFSFLLRIYKINNLFYFSYDEEIPAFVGRRLILGDHIPLIGGVTPFHFHLGPYFYWFYSLLLLFSKFDPIIWGWVGAALSGVTVFLIFLVSRQIGGRKLAITCAILWTFSLLANIYDRHLWALYWGPIISLITIYSLNKIIAGNKKYLYVICLSLALSIHADLSNLIFFALTFIAWLIFKISVKKSTLIAFSIVPLLFLPLLVFDLRHNFANTRPAGDFISEAKHSSESSLLLTRFKSNVLFFPNTFARLVYKYGDNEVAKQYSYCRDFIDEKNKAVPFAAVIVASAIILAFLFWSFFISGRVAAKLTSITFVLYFLGINVYGTLLRGDIFEHYITGLLPIFLIMLGLVIIKLPKYLWLTTLALFVTLNLFKLTSSVNSQGLLFKKEAINFTAKETDGSEFSLESLSTCWRYSGYRYLFAAYGKEPTKSFVDPNLGYLYINSPIANTHPDLVVAFITHDFKSETPYFYQKYAIYKSHQRKNAIFGNIEVIIMDNSTKWFF